MLSDRKRCDTAEDRELRICAKVDTFCLLFGFHVLIQSTDKSITEIKTLPVKLWHGGGHFHMVILYQMGGVIGLSRWYNLYHCKSFDDVLLGLCKTLLAPRRSVNWVKTELIIMLRLLLQT